MTEASRVLWLGRRGTLPEGSSSHFWLFGVWDLISSSILHPSARPFHFICCNKSLYIVAATSIKVTPDVNVLWMFSKELKKISLKLLITSGWEGLISQSIRSEDWAAKTLMGGFQSCRPFRVSTRWRRQKADFAQWVGKIHEPSPEPWLH